MATTKTTTADETKAKPDPVGKPVEPGPKAETMDDQGIAANQPYPTGSPQEKTYAEITGVADATKPK